MVDRRTILAGMAAAPARAEGGLAGYTLARLEGGPLPLNEFAGRAVLIVNTASFCGFTPQYTGLQRLHDRFEARGLTVLGVPSNDFQQESTSNQAIRDFCDGIFGITFPMAALSHVRGPRALPLYQWLARKAGGPPRWNFHKYLVTRDGLRVRSFATMVEPGSREMLRAVEAVMG